MDALAPGDQTEIESGGTDPQLGTVLRILRPLGKTRAVVDMPTQIDAGME
ncbi:MAG: hypothetical protein LBS18_05345 [Clostridiales bacterium]|nr:hypothetical protein [Clostridiales bacterium]